MGSSNISSGVVSQSVVIAQFDDVAVLSGGVVISATVVFEGDLFIEPGGTGSATSIESGGGVFVDGAALDDLISSGGIEFVMAEGTATSTSIEAGGVQQITDGGLGASTFIAFGGRQTVSNGGAYEAFVGGVQFVSAGGTAEASEIVSGGVQEVQPGGVAKDTKIDSGGVLVVLPDGLVTSAAVLPGGQIISTGVVVNTPSGVSFFAGVADGLILNGPDSAFILSGGIVETTAVNSGAIADVQAGGAASALIVTGGGEVIVAAGGVVSAAGIAGGGALILSGGIGYATVVSGADAANPSYENIVAGGSANLTVVASGGAENISGGTADGTVLNGGAQFIQSGSAVATTIGANGYQLVGPQGFAMSNTVLGGGSENIIGGSAVASLVEAFGQEIVSLGGIVTDTVIESGGVQNIGPGGLAISTAVMSGGVQILSGGVASGTVLQAGAAAFVSVDADFPSAVSEAIGTVIETGAAAAVGAGALAENVEIAGGILELAAGSVVSGGVTFTQDGGALFVDSTVLPGVVISGFGHGDSIFIPDLSYDATDDVSVTAPNQVTILAESTSTEINIAGAEGKVFQLSPLNGGVLLTEDLTMPCFAEGTGILTPSGRIAVEYLAAGDHVVTRSGADEPIIWIGKREVDLRRHAKPEAVQPVFIEAGALADDVPERTILLSPDHALYLEGHLIPAKALINGATIRQLNLASVVYYHIELARHDVIFAEALPVESYLDTGNRNCFVDMPGGTMLHPDFGQRLREAKSCAPFAEAGVEVEQARAKIAARMMSAKECSFSEEKEPKRLLKLSAMGRDNIKAPGGKL